MSNLKLKKSKYSKKYISDFEDEDIVIGIEKTKPKLLLALIGLSGGVGDVITTWYALNYNKGIEDNPVTIKSIESYGLTFTLIAILFTTILLSFWSFLYSNYKTIDYLFKAVTLLWVVQKVWVLASNLIVLQGGNSISMVHLLKIHNII